MNSEIPLVQQRLNPVRVSKQEFLKLTKMPIFIGTSAQKVGDMI